MNVFPDEMTIQEALKLLFEKSGIPENAYTAKTFTIQIGSIGIPVPNIPARVKIAKLHDIHHILTGYEVNWKGEAEIGAWELATGCRSSFIAWYLNTGAMIVGLFMHPIAVIQAFIRGRNTKTNLYYDFHYETILNKTVRELKAEIGLPLELKA